jgi:hypothetical protein
MSSNAFNEIEQQYSKDLNRWETAKEKITTVQYIDPPEGWRYGFPKVIPDGVVNTSKWLVEQGYPQKLIDEFGEYFCCRFWKE